MESFLTAEVSASAVRWNLALLRERLSRGCKLCAVVKADCYGHGLRALLGVLAAEADWLAVATPQEALLLRRLGYRRGILMFFSACAQDGSGGAREALEDLIAREVTLTVVSAAELDAVEAAAVRAGRPAAVHVKVDSGMGRSGTPAEDLAALVAEVRRRKAVTLTGVYSHLATADETDKEAACQQLACFQAAVAAAGGGAGLVLHLANSAATIDLPETHLDMVRPGIAVYGYQPSNEMTHRLPLRPAMRVTGRLMQIKAIPASSRCGYGLTYTFRRDSRVGLVPVGYADGYLRTFSSRTIMRVDGRDVPVCGRVSMDQAIIDLTDCPTAAVGDEVEIISADPAAPHSVENLARLAGTIPYEITCRLGRRVRRVLVK
ncbi:MAG: alanine racemase [Phycisphaerae bacterium]|nr:alanine racemase [Phycisphaerae bacterium]